MSAVLELLLEPMRYEFFRNALLAALMVGVLSGVMGVYIVLRIKRKPDRLQNTFEVGLNALLDGIAAKVEAHQR